MNRWKERMKAETEKYSQKFFGSSNSESAEPAPASGHDGGHHHQQQFDNSKLQFEVHPCPDPSNISPSSREVKILNVTELGDVRSLTTNVVRDLGFAGQIGQYVLLSYGDTMYTDENLSHTPFKGMTSNSVALSTHDPLRVVDPKLNRNGWPDQFVQINKDWDEDMSTHAVGITNVVETDASKGEGVIFTLLNHRPDGKDHILGAGVATVTLQHGGDGLPTPTATRHQPFIWPGDSEPHFGDVSAVRTQSHIYAYGHKHDNPWVYLCRVPVGSALDPSAYEYWHGAAKGWSPDRLSGPDVGDEQSVFWQINQGQVIYSPYFEKFLFVYCDAWWSCKLLLRHAERPEGPWSECIDIHKCTPIQEGGNVYSAAPQAQFDSSGKTLVVCFTNHPNCVQAVKVEFE